LGVSVAVLLCALIVVFCTMMLFIPAFNRRISATAFCYVVSAVGAIVMLEQPTPEDMTSGAPLYVDFIATLFRGDVLVVLVQLPLLAARVPFLHAVCILSSFVSFGASLLLAGDFRLPTVSTGSRRCSRCR
jgi:hypothetical protein